MLAWIYFMKRSSSAHHHCRHLICFIFSAISGMQEEKREEGKEEEEERKNGIAANKSKQDSEEDSLTALLPAPLDGGWGWVVLAASFVCSAVVEGLITLLGILLPDLLSHFGGTRAKTTIAGSLMTGSFLLTGQCHHDVVTMVTSLLSFQVLLSVLC